MTYSKDNDNEESLEQEGYKVITNPDGTHSWNYLGRQSVQSFPTVSDTNLDFIDTTVEEINERRRYTDDEEE